jgi:hypothetical protein
VKLDGVGSEDHFGVAHLAGAADQVQHQGVAQLLATALGQQGNAAHLHTPSPV